jgi:hypothetical protein
LSIHARKRDGGRVGQALGTGGVDNRRGESGQQLRLETIAELGQPLTTLNLFCLPNLQCHLHSDGQSHAFGAWSQARLLKSTVQNGLKADTVSDQ